MIGRVLIFGASGFLGQRLFSGFPEFEVLGTSFSHPNGDLISIDLRDTAAATALVKATAPDAIIYAAALSDTAGCERDQDTARLVNTITPAAIASGTSCPMIYISSDYVFDGLLTWHRETGEAIPTSHYGKTKLAGEQAVLRASSHNAILRVSGLFDEYTNSSGLLSATSCGRVDLVSTPLHVDDAVSAVRTILKNTISGILHAGGPDRMTRYDLLQLSRLRFWDAPDVIPAIGSDGYKRPSCSALVCDRLQSTGWTARRPVTTFLPAIFDNDSLHLRVLTSPKKNIVLLDCVGALLTNRCISSDRWLYDINQACGQVTEEESFWSYAASQTGDPDIIDRISDCYVINPGLWRYVIQLRREGYQLIAANNGAFGTFSKWCNRLGIDIWFQDAVNSLDFGFEKSNPAFFKALANRSKCQTTNFVLYDDNLEVCRAAHAVGVTIYLTKRLRIGSLDAHDVDPIGSLPRAHEFGVEDTKALETCEPDALFFRQIRFHAKILRRPEREQYFMLSSGTNSLPLWNEWSRLSSIEIEEQFSQAWYTSQSGFPLLSHSAAVYENTVALGKFSLDRKPLGRSAAMTFGASQALALVLDHLAESVNGASLLVIEPCYPLVFRQAARSRIRIVGVSGDGNSLMTMLPSAQEVVSKIKLHSPTALLLSCPSNPGGENYSDSELRDIAEMCALCGTILIVDRVGELVNDVPATRALAETEYLNDGTLQCVVINSLSKSESLAGYRIGYVVGPTSFIDAVAAHQLHASMNPPTVPALAVFLTFILRCAQLPPKDEAQAHIAHYARRMFRSTTAIAPKMLVSKVEHLLDHEFQALFDSYQLHQKEIMGAIKTNEASVNEIFGTQIVAATARGAGLNKAVVFAESIGRPEDSFCQEVIERSSVAIITESCFRSSKPSRPWYWTRISLASPTKDLAAACKRMVTS